VTDPTSTSLFKLLMFMIASAVRLHDGHLLTSKEPLHWDEVYYSMLKPAEQAYYTGNRFSFATPWRELIVPAAMSVIEPIRSVTS